MWRLVLVHENNLWAPKLINQANNTCRQVTTPFEYSPVYKIGGFFYFNERVFVPLYNAHFERVVCIIDAPNFLPPVTPESYIVFRELTQITHYPAFVYSLFPVPICGLATQTVPEAAHNWHSNVALMHNPVAQLTELGAAQFPPSHDIAAAIQAAHAATERAQIAECLLFQAHKEIEHLARLAHASAHAPVADTPPILEEKPEPMPELDLAELRLSLPTRPFSAPPCVQHYSSDEESAATPQQVSSFSSDEHQSAESETETETETADSVASPLITSPVISSADPSVQSLNKQKRQAEFQALLAQLPTELIDDTSCQVALKKLLIAMQELVTVKENKDQLLKALHAMPVGLCNKLIHAKQLPKHIRELLLKHLITYPVEQQVILTNTDQLISVAMQVSKDMVLHQAIRTMHKANLEAKRTSMKAVPLPAPVAVAVVKPIKKIDPKHQLRASIKTLDLVGYATLLQQQPDLHDYAQKVLLESLPELCAQDLPKLTAFLISTGLPESFWDKVLSGALSLEFKSALIDAIPPAKAWHAAKTTELFEKFEGTQKGKINADLLPLFAQATNLKKQTILMLAIKRGYPLEVLRPILNASGEMLLQADVQNQTVWHYFARFYKPENAEFAKELRVAFEVAVVKYSRNLLAEVNRQSIASGDTYMHILLQDDNPECVLQILELLFDNRGRKKGYLNPFRTTALLQNNKDASCSVVLDNSANEQPKIRHAIYLNLLEVFDKLATLPDLPTHVYFPDGKNFFYAAEDSDPIWRLIDSKQYKRLVTIVNQRLIMSYTVSDKATEFGNSTLTKPDPCKVDFYIKLLPYLGHYQTHERLYKAQTMYGHIAKHICSTSDIELETLFVDSTFYKRNVVRLPITDTLFWLRLNSLADKPEKTGKDILMLQGFAVFLIDEHIDAQRFLQEVIIHGCFVMFTLLLNNSQGIVKQKLLMLLCNAILETKKYDCIAKIKEQFDPVLNEEFKLYLLNLSVEKNDLALAEALIRAYNGLLSHRHLRAVFEATTEINSTFELLFAHFESTLDKNDPAFRTVMYFFFEGAITSQEAESKTSWLIKRGYDPTVTTKNHKNLLHTLFIYALKHPLAYGTETITWLHMMVEILFQNPEVATVLATQKNGQDSNHGCIYYLGRIGKQFSDPDGPLPVIFQECLRYGGDISELSTDPNYTSLHYAVDLNDFDLLQAFSDKLNDDEISTMITTKHNGKDLLQIATEKHARGQLSKEALDWVKEMAVVPEANVLETAVEGVDRIFTRFGL